MGSAHALNHEIMKSYIMNNDSCLDKLSPCHCLPCMQVLFAHPRRRHHQPLRQGPRRGCDSQAMRAASPQDTPADEPKPLSPCLCSRSPGRGIGGTAAVASFVPRSLGGFCSAFMVLSPSSNPCVSLLPGMGRTASFASLRPGPPIFSLDVATGRRNAGPLGELVLHCIVQFYHLLLCVSSLFAACDERRNAGTLVKGAFRHTCASHAVEVGGCWWRLVRQGFLIAECAWHERWPTQRGAPEGGWAATLACLLACFLRLVRAAAQHGQLSFS
jgi:hypothetical protein